MAKGKKPGDRCDQCGRPASKGECASCGQKARPRESLIEFLEFLRNGGKVGDLAGFINQGAKQPRAE